MAVDKRPYIVWLHGLGDSGAGWRDLERSPGLSEFKWTFPDAPEMPITVNGGTVMPGWFDAVEIPIAPTTPDDAAGFAASMATVHGLLDAAIADGHDSRKCFVGGFSQGAALAVFSATAYPKPLGGCIMFSGWTAFKDEYPARIHDSNKALPLLVCHGTVDPVVLPKCADATKETLEAAGLPVAVHKFPVPHTFAAQEARLLREFVIERVAAGGGDKK